MQLAWATDIHWNFVSSTEAKTFFDAVRDVRAEALVLTGDISEAPRLAQDLATIRKGVGLPIYYVLGNHDFYYGSIARVRENARKRNAGNFGETWLRGQVIQLSETWGMVGVDGWGDGRNGNFQLGKVQLNDERLIEELKRAQAHVSHAARLNMVHSLGYEEGVALGDPLWKALERFPKVLVLTHVPPFPGAAWHEGHPSEPNWVPWFSCKGVGDVLLKAAEAFPTKEILVLCGHTHGQGTYQAAPNLKILTGEAAYYFALVREVELL